MKLVQNLFLHMQELSRAPENTMLSYRQEGKKMQFLLYVHKNGTREDL